MISQAHMQFIGAARASGVPADQVRRFRAAGYVPQPKQLAFHAACRAADRPGGPTCIGFGGARGGGKSAASFAQVAADDCQRRKNLKVLFLRKVGKAAKESFGDLIRKMFPPWVGHYVTTRNIIVWPQTGSRILIGHFQTENDIDNYLGLEYDVIVIEEVTQLSQAKIEMIETCLRTDKPDWRPRMYVTFNPGGVGHGYIKQRLWQPFVQNRETETRFIPATVDDNQFVNREYRKTLDRLTGWKLKAWRYGDMEIAAGQFFTMWSRETHVVRHGDIAPSDNWTFWGALDYGYIHPTAMYLFGQNGDGTVVILDEHVQSRWVVSRHADAWKALLARNGLDQARLWTMVAGTDVFAKKQNGRAIADDYADQGISLRAAKTDRVLGAARMLEALGDRASGIEPWMYISERCGKLIDLLPSLEHDPHNPEAVLKKDANEEGLHGDDPYDAARYGLNEAGRHALLYDFG